MENVEIYTAWNRSDTWGWLQERNSVWIEEAQARLMALEKLWKSKLISLQTKLSVEEDKCYLTVCYMHMKHGYWEKILKGR